MIFIASDHAGFELKNKIVGMLTKQGYHIKDLGPYEYDKNDDYPDYAEKLCKELMNTTEGRGILICGTGIGMSITANKFKGVRAALCFDEFTARASREHNDANVLCLGARTIKEDEAIKIVKTWLEAEFSGEARHQRRINKIKNIEERAC